MNQPRYARLPLDVLRHPGLGHWAKLVYAEMAANVFQGSVARIGLRLLAERVGCGRGTAARAVAELQRLDLIEIRKRDRTRSLYVLLSPVFGQKQRSGELEEVVPAPSGGRRLASVRIA